MLVHHETLIQYLKDLHILQVLCNRQKNHLKHIVGTTIEVEVPPVCERVVCHPAHCITIDEFVGELLTN